jgi:hypothetical protein
MASAMAARSLAGIRFHTLGLGVGRIGLPPGGGHSLEDGDQLGNGSCRQNGWLRTRLGRQVRAGDRDESELTREDFDLAMADVSGQMRQPCQLQNAAIKRMTRIGNGDLALAHLSDQRCIAVAGVFQSRGRRMPTRSLTGPRTSLPRATAPAGPP